MSPEAQRIAIAEACGWEDIHKQHFTCYLHIHYDRLFGYPRIDGALCHESEAIPNYTVDLNAMHEAEKVLTLDQKHAYCKELRKGNVNRFSIFATAAQRAEALLKCLNLWTTK